MTIWTGDIRDYEVRPEVEYGILPLDAAEIMHRQNSLCWKGLVDQEEDARQRVLAEGRQRDRAWIERSLRLDQIDGVGGTISTQIVNYCLNCLIRQAH